MNQRDEAHVLSLYYEKRVMKLLEGKVAVITGAARGIG